MFSLITAIFSWTSWPMVIFGSFTNACSSRQKVA